MSDVRVITARHVHSGSSFQVNASRVQWQRIRGYSEARYDEISCLCTRVVFFAVDFSYQRSLYNMIRPRDPLFHCIAMCFKP